MNEETRSADQRRDAVAERDRLKAVLWKIQHDLDECDDEWRTFHCQVQETLNAETRRSELIEAGRAEELARRTVAGELRRRAEAAEAERDRLLRIVEIAERVVDRSDPEQWSLNHDAFVDLGVALDQLAIDTALGLDVSGEGT